MLSGRLRIAILACLASVGAAGCADLKSAGRTIGHTTRDVTRDIGHATRDVTRDIGHATRDAAKDLADGPEPAPDSRGK
jgi:hypothetical protein